MRWGMAIELKRCIGCNACVLACKAEHFLPPHMFWNRVLIGEKGKYPQVTKLIYSVRCNHCAEPKCVKVCPTGATQQREDGIVWIDDTKCVGCRYCMVACPYDARRFNWGEREDVNAFVPTWGIAEVERPPRGVVEKCTFCVHRIDAGLANGLVPGVDPEATPACVNICPVDARVFGDLKDPDSRVAKLIEDSATFRLREELGTRPSVYYIPPKEGV